MTGPNTVVSVWVSPQADVVHLAQECAPTDATEIGAVIRESDCTGDYAVLPTPPHWYVLGNLCRCRTVACPSCGHEFCVYCIEKHTHIGP